MQCNTSSGALKKERKDSYNKTVRKLKEDFLKHDLTLNVGLQVSGQLHGENGVEQSGDEGSVQTAHRSEHFEEQQPQRHTMLLHRHTHGSHS